MSTKDVTKDKEQTAQEETKNQAEKEQNIENQDTEANEEAQGEESSGAELDELSALKEELGKLKDQHMRLYADFENHKKRTARERVELFGSANQELMSALLPVWDDFKRALKNLEGEEAHSGVQLIFNKFENTLKQKGLKPMESSEGKDFDLETMEAVTRIPAPSNELKGKVVDELEQGFQLGNKIIRYARVVVGE